MIAPASGVFRSHASPLLRTLHCLPVQQRIKYKMALLMFKVHSTSTLSYLCRLIQDRHTATTCDQPLRHCVGLQQRWLLWSALTDALLRLFWTHCRKLSLIVTLLRCISLSDEDIPLFSRLSLLALLTNTLPGPSACEVTTLSRYTNLLLLLLLLQ